VGSRERLDGLPRAHQTRGHLSQLAQEKIPKTQRFTREKMAFFMKLRAKIIHIKYLKSIGQRAILRGENLGVRRTIFCRSAKNIDKTAQKMGQNACPIGVARKMVSRIVLRTSRESV
jgi:hypothetical protein